MKGIIKYMYDFRKKFDYVKLLSLYKTVAEYNLKQPNLTKHHQKLFFYYRNAFT